MTMDTSEKNTTLGQAIDALVQALKPLKDTDRVTAIRAACEHLGTQFSTAIAQSMDQSQQTAISTDRSCAQQPAAVTQQPAQTTDIRSFVENKKPKTDQHFAAVVAYFYRFVAPEQQKKPAINGEDLLEACRLTGRKRPPRPATTLNNAFKFGLLERGDTGGSYSINSVGENLVAMAMPADGPNSTATLATSRTLKTKKVAKSKKNKASKTSRKKRKNDK